MSRGDWQYDGPQISKAMRRAIKNSRQQISADVKIYTGKDAKKLGEECGYKPPKKKKKNKSEFLFRNME
jgi:hypothetical protein